MRKVVLSWSSGKDSALTLYYLKNFYQFDSIHLITTINTEYNRVFMHGLRKELLEMQLQALDIPYTIIPLSSQPSNEEYEGIMRNYSLHFKNQGFDFFAFGDIFLRDLREYREKNLKPLNIECVFPLWGKNTKEIIYEFINLGFEAIIISVNAEVVGEEFLGRKIDTDFLKDIPASVDPCGENGEFHTFCYNGPIFKNKIPFSLGEKVKREYQTKEKTYSYFFLDIVAF